MRVLFMNSIKPHIWRGGEKWMLEMASGLTERGHTVHLGVRPTSLIADQARKRKLNVFPIRYGPDIDPLAAFNLRRYVKSHGIELICTNFDKELRLAAQASLFTERPVIVARKGLPYVFDKWYYRLTYRHWVDHIVSPSRSIAFKLRQLPWLREIEISVIPNGVRIGDDNQGSPAPSLRSQYGIPEQVALLGFVGDLCRQKGVDTLLRAFRMVEEKCHLVLIGSGGERASLERLAGKLKLEGRVTFAGHRQDAIHLYDQFDMVLCPSLFEGMPNVVLEAMAAGRPVIASAVGGVLEVFGNRRSGFLVPPGDEQALSSAIVDLLNDPTRREAMGATGKKWVSENFSLERTVDRLEDLFQRLIDGRRGRPTESPSRPVGVSTRREVSPVKKEAYLVLGPQSCGNHLVTDILLNAGCLGHSGDHPEWHGDFKGWADGQPWDENPPTDETPIVWRRSIPHGGKWTNLTSFINRLRQRGFEVKCVVIVRDSHAAVESQLKWHHVRSFEEGRSNIGRAYLHIFSHLARAKVPFVVTSYEALVNYPQAQDHLLEQLGIPLPPARLETWDGNGKWYSGFSSDRTIP